MKKRKTILLIVITLLMLSGCSGDGVFMEYLTRPIGEMPTFVFIIILAVIAW